MFESNLKCPVCNKLLLSINDVIITITHPTSKIDCGKCKSLLIEYNESYDTICLLKTLVKQLNEFQHISNMVKSVSKYKK